MRMETWSAINTAVLNRAYGGPEGIGFAIPVNLVRGVMEQILRQGHVGARLAGFRGLRTCPTSRPRSSESRAGGGITVVNILVKSPAFESGVRPGDLITGLAGEPVRSSQDLVQQGGRAAARRPWWISKGGTVASPTRFKLKVLERPTRPVQPQ